MAQTDGEKWLQYAEEYAASLEDWQRVPVISREEDINETMSIPGIIYSANPSLTNLAKPQNFVQFHLATLFTKINNMLGTVEDALSGYEELKTQTMQARDAANTAATNANGIYETVNAWWPTFKSTVEGFYNNTMLGTWVGWYNSFTAAAEAWKTNTMDAIDAWWATFKPTVENWFSARQQEWATWWAARQQDISDWNTWFNARKQDWTTWYGARQQEWNTWWDARLQDVEDWSAWVTARQQDWTTWFTNGVMVAWETLRQNVVNATDAANTAAGLANAKAQYAQTQGDRAKGYNDHPWVIGDDGYIYVWDETTSAMKKTNKCIIDFEDLTEEQMEEIISHVAIVTASVETCEAIIDELI